MCPGSFDKKAGEDDVSRHFVAILFLSKLSISNAQLVISSETIVYSLKILSKSFIVYGHQRDASKVKYARRV